MIKCEKMKEKGKTGMAGSDRSHFFHTGFCGVVTGRDKSSFGYLSFLFYSFFRTDTKKALQRLLSYPVTFFLSRRCMCVILKTDYTQPCCFVCEYIAQRVLVSFFCLFGTKVDFSRPFSQGVTLPPSPSIPFQIRLIIPSFAHKGSKCMSPFGLLISVARLSPLAIATFGLLHSFTE